MKLIEHRVDDIMTLVRRPVRVRPEETYHEIGIRSFGNGIFHKPPISGHELGSKKVFYIEPGDLIFSNVFAWEGAVALASERESGRIGSHRFMTYEVDLEKADPRYLRYYFYGGQGLAVVNAASPGSAGRNRTLGIKTFNQQKVVLPPKQEQRRIADKLDALLSQETAARHSAISCADETTSMIDAIESRFYNRGLAEGWQLRRLDDLAEVNPGTDRPRAGEVVAFVPMSALNSATGVIDDKIRMDAAEIGKGYKLFRRGDVIFARITPCMQNGKSAIFSDEKCEHGYGSTEFHVVRPSTELEARWIHHFLRSYAFRRKAAHHMTGTAGQQRLPAAYLRDVEVPIPDTTEERESALRRLDDLQSTRVRFKVLHVARMSSLKVLSKSILQAALSGRL